MNSMPTHMKCFLLNEHHERVDDAIQSLQVAELPIEAPNAGEVLVKIEAAPCNPSDLVFLQGRATMTRQLPAVPGWEGAGKVVASGGGWLANWMVNKRVACAARRNHNGTWAEYAVVHASECMPLMGKVRYRQAASLIVNPLSAIGLLDVARRGGHKGAVNTAAASQLGRMIITLARERSFPLVNVVRRQDQVELLKKAGAEIVLDSTASDFADAFAAACQERSVTCAFDAIAGESTGELLGLLPPHSEVVVYGALSDGPCGKIDPVELIYRDKRISSFYLSRWIRSQGKIRSLLHSRKIQSMILGGSVKTEVRAEAGFDAMKDALLDYVATMTNGKVLLVPSKS